MFIDNTSDCSDDMDEDIVDKNGVIDYNVSQVTDTDNIDDMR